jgi:hypothetical protein
MIHRIPADAGSNHSLGIHIPHRNGARDDKVGHSSEIQDEVIRPQLTR